MKSLVKWHSLYDSLKDMTCQLTPSVSQSPNHHHCIAIFSLFELQGNRGDHIISRVPDAALLWRLSIVREVVFSGFQLELYTMEERMFAYWYVTQVIEEHLSCLDNWIPVVLKSKRLIFCNVADISECLQVLRHTVR
jgi:hypothetical protein